MVKCYENFETIAQTTSQEKKKEDKLTRLLTDTAGVLSGRSGVGAAAGETFANGPKELPSRGCRKHVNMLK